MAGSRSSGLLVSRTLPSLVLPFTILVLSAAIVGTYGALGAQRKAFQAVDHSRDVQRQIDQTLSLLTDAETGQRGYLLTGETRELEPYRAALEQLPSAMQALGKLTADNLVQTQQLASVQSHLREQLAELSDTIALRDAGDSERALEAVRSGHGTQFMQTLRADLANMADEEQRLLVERGRSAAWARGVTQLAVGSMGALALLLLWLLYRVMSRESASLLESISRREAAESRLRELNDELERRVAEALAERGVLLDIVEATDARVLVLDPSYRILAINRAAASDLEQLFRVRAKVGDNLLALLEPFSDARAKAQLYWGRALQGEEYTAIDAFQGGNERRHYEMKFNSLRDAKGGFLGAFQFVYDVTERLREQARLAEAENHLRQTQKFDAIGQLSGGIAHDFNNLLMVISGGLSLLQRSDDPQKRQRIVEQMRQAADRGASLSRQLLTFARRRPLRAEALNLRQQISGMREILDRTLRGDVVVQTDLPADLWPIYVDPSEFELVLLNLCVNARDAMPKGGTILITASNSPALEEEGLKGDFVTLSVADTGIGMSSEILARVFEPFFTTKELGKGSGLGLAQVYGFAQQSGGTVRIESVPDKGTVVHLLMPRSPHAAPAPSEDVKDVDTISRPRLVMGSVLLVEDAEEVAVLVSEMLSELGYRVTRVASAQAALGALSDNRDIDLVFSDVMMPGPINGLELARELRRRRPDLPVLLTTGYAGSALSGAYAEHVNVLAKPYELSELDAALRAARKRRASAKPIDGGSAAVGHDA